MGAAKAVGLELSFILMFEMYVFVLRKQFLKQMEMFWGIHEVKIIHARNIHCVPI